MAPDRFAAAGTVMESLKIRQVFVVLPVASILLFDFSILERKACFRDVITIAPKFFNGEKSRRRDVR